MKATVVDQLLFIYILNMSSIIQKAKVFKLEEQWDWHEFCFNGCVISKSSLWCQKLTGCIMLKQIYVFNLGVLCKSDRSFFPLFSCSLTLIAPRLILIFPFLQRVMRRGVMDNLLEALQSGAAFRDQEKADSKESR